MSTLVRILHVDDNPHDRELVRDALEREAGGFRVISASTRVEFEAKLVAEQYDLVLSDFNILGFDGLQVLDTVRALDPLIPVIIVTGTGSEEAAVAAMKQGAADYVLKSPQHIRRLPATIRGALEKLRLQEAQKHAEEALKASERRFRLLYEEAPLAYQSLDENARILDVNRAWLKLLGYSRDEVLGKWMGDFLTPAFRKLLPERFKQFLAANETHGVEFEIVRKDGTTVAVELEGVIARDEEGRFRQTHCIFNNITERKRAEAQVRSVSRFPAEDPDPVLRLSSDGTILYANKASAPLLGAWGRQIGQIVPPDWQALLVSVLSSFVNKEVEIACGERVFSCILAPIMNAGYVNVYGRDATEHKWAEQELRESEERYRSLVEVCPDAIFVTRDDKIVVANKAGLQLFGATRPEQIIGKSPLDFVPREHHAAARERMLHQKESGAHAVLAEAQFHRLDGKPITVEVALAPILDRAGAALLAVMRDITERKQLEAQFRQAQKMDAIGQLAGGVAHDFSNVLAIIMARSELSMHRLTPQEPLWQELDLIRKTGERASALVRQLMAFSRRQVMRPKLLDLNAVVIDMETMLRRVIGEDIALSTLLEPKLRLVKADPSQVEQVLMNLVVNARDAMPKGGKLSIETANVTLDETYCRQHADASPGPHVLLAVTDSGCGMDAAVLSRVFEPFFTTKEPGRGTGLGLSTVYGIVKQSNGSIQVYSEPGKGTAFKVYLPRTDDEAVPAASSGGMPAVTRGTETIMVVEDEEIVGNLVREVLAHNGYRVLQARHGAEALLLSEKYEGPIHLLLTDVTMPEISGPELARHLARLRPDTKVLFMSGYTNHAAVNHGMLAHGAPFIEKPFTPIALARAVRNALDGP